MTTGEIIKQQRRAAGMTQEALGKRLGLKKAAIGKYESGRAENIKYATLMKLSSIFHCSPTPLWGCEAYTIVLE